MAKIPPHFFVYSALAIGVVGGGAASLMTSMVYPWQLWFTDMMDSEMVKAYEAPMRAPPEGSVSRDDWRPNDEPYGESKLRMTPEGAALTNPYPADDLALAKGEWAFGVYCAPCHGAKGDGKGTVTENRPAEGKNRFQLPAPALFGSAGMLRLRTDGYLYLTIRNGGALMPAYGVQLSEKEIWSLVSYLRQTDKKG